MGDELSRLTAALSDRYRIERELGAGGMATVYLARDVRHDRQVAVKVLRPELGAVLGAERFLAEIRITAGLEHPHILTLIDSGEAGGLLYYVLPFIRGESLRDRLTREQQLGIVEALAITRQIASALDHAHHKGVIHRDIKPENILLHEGEAMLADFGIALAVKEAGGNRLTETGLSLGTPQYMSPEQATGERMLTPRSDVYSLAAVFYEMLAGEPPVTGPNAQAMVAKLMTERPVSLRVVRDTVPEAMDLAVQKALAKVPADRFASAGEFVRALEAAQAGASGSSPRSAAGASRRRWVPWAGLAALLVLVIAIWALRNPTPPRLELGRSDQLTADPGLEIQPALSPDGKFVAYAEGTQNKMRIYIRPLGGGRTIPLSDDSTSVETHPVWSPDGLNLLFLTKYGVSVAPALGGTSRSVVAPPRDLTTASTVVGVQTATWSPSGTDIAFARDDSLWVMPVSGGEPRLVGSGVQEMHSCAWSPDGKWIACVSGNVESVFPGQGFGNLSPSAVVLFPASGGGATTLIPSGVVNQSPVWTGDSRRLLFVSTRDGPRDVYAQQLSSAGKATGAPVRITTGLGTLSVSLSADGRRMAYTAYTADANLWSLPVGAGTSANGRAATQLTTSHQVIEYSRVSRDGLWLLFDSNLRGNADIFRLPIGGGNMEQLTSDSADEFGPDLSPDGKEVAYHVWRNGTRDIAVKPLNGGPVQLVAASATQESFPVWTPDGQALLFWDQAGAAPGFVVHRGADGTWGKPNLLLQRCLFPDISPDGGEIAYSTAPPSLQPGLRVIPLSGGTPRKVYQPGPDGPWAEKAIYSPDGKTLYFKSHDAQQRTGFYAVPSAGGTPRLMARLDDPSWQSIRPFFATDGQRFFFPVEDRQSDIYVAEVAQ